MNDPTEPSDLRQRALARLAAEGPQAEGLFPDEAARLIHELRVHQIELEMQNHDLRETQTRLEGSLRKYADLYDSAPVGYLTLDDEGAILKANLTAAAFLDRERSRLLNQPFPDFLVDYDRPAFRLMLNNSLFHERQQREFYLHGNGRGLRVILLDIISFPDGNGQKRHRLTMTDISKLTLTQKDLQVSLRFLEAVQRHGEILPLLDEFVAIIKDHTGCEAVSIRVLDSEGNIPYQAYLGFSQAFYDLESPLSIHSDNCMCISVIKGETDPRLPFYTPGGSFYINGTTRFLATVAADDKGSTRNVCNQVGYESVALAPFRRGSQILGLIQVADPRENMVPLHVVETLEKAGIQLGAAFLRLQAEAALQESELRFRQMAEAVGEVFWLSTADAQTILYVSPAFESLWGHSCAELYANPHLWLEAIHPEDVPQAFGSLEEVMAGRPFDIEYRITRPDGSVRWINDRGYPFMDASGRVTLTCGVASDITRRKEAENALKTSEEKFRLAMEAIQEGVWDWNLATGELYINPAFMRSFGYDPELVEHTYDFWVKAIHPTDLQDYQEKLEAHLAGHTQAFETELRGRMPDGQCRWFSSRGRVVARAEDGTPLRMVGTLRDITDKKLAQAGLEESLSLHKATLESTADGILVVNLAQQIVSWNRKLIDMWRLPEDLVGDRDNVRVRTRASDQLVDPSSFNLRAQEIFLDPAEETFDVLHFKDGRVFERYTFPQYLGGQIVGRVLSFRDVTARARAEAALKESESKYRCIVETANEGIWAMDGNYLTTFVNQQMAALLGYKPPEMVGRPVQDFVFPEDLADHREKMIQRQQGQDDNYERRFRRKDGSELWTIVSVRAVKGEAGEFLGSFAMLTDITERKRAEEELKKSEERVRTKLESILAPEGDIGQLNLEDIIDVPAIQSLMSHFYLLTHLPMFLIDLRGKVLVGVGWQDLCTKFHRVHPETCRRCVESDTVLSGDVPPGTFKLYKCKNHMWDLVTPIMAGGKHAGNLFMGQFLFADEKPDYEFFRAQAREFGFDEEAYLAALAQVPRLDRETVDRAMAFFTELARMISLLSLSNLKLARAVGEQERLVESLRLSDEKSRADEAFLSDVFNSIKDGLTVLDLERTIIRVNPGLEELAPAQDLVGRKCYEVFHQRDQVCPDCPVEHTFKTGEAHQSVSESVGAGGERRCMEIYSYPLINRSTGELAGVIEYVRDVTERQEAQEALEASHRALEETAQELEQSRNMLQLVLESIPVRVFWKDQESRYLGCNTLFARDAGCQKPQELLGKDDFVMGWSAQADLYRTDDREIMESRQAKMNMVEPQTTPSGANIWLKTSKVPLSYASGEVFGVLGVYEDITDLKEKEDQLRASLQEKEVMLKEIHHRVKNNMQMISTLFDLQLKYGGDQDPAAIFRDCQNRIRSMALIHESLYQKDTLASINFRQYLERLVKRLLTSFGSSVQGVGARVSGADMHLDINQAVPAGLVASEIIVNCLKHAFPGQQRGDIQISLEVAAGKYVIEIKDNGVGLSQDFSMENSTTFGWLMITNLMKQMEGAITVTSNGGTTCRMVF
jgi:PAS domain S-box-containing protein